MALFCLVAGSYKSQGLVLVELQEMFPDYTATEVLWIYGVAQVAGRISGE